MSSTLPVDSLIVRLPDKRLEIIHVSDNDTIWMAKIQIFTSLNISPFKQRLFLPDNKELEDNNAKLKDFKELKQVKDEKRLVILKEINDEKKKAQKKKRGKNDKVKLVRGKKFKENVVLSFCYAVGRGLARGVKDLEAEFSIQAVNKDFQAIIPKDESAIEVDISKNDNPQLSITPKFLDRIEQTIKIEIEGTHITTKWVPTEIGTYTISIKIGDNHISGSPFKATVIDHENNGGFIKKMAYDKDWNVEAAKIVADWASTEQFDKLIFNDIKMETIFHLLKSEPQHLIQPLIGSTLDRLLIKDMAKKVIFNGGISMILELAELNTITKSNIISRYISRCLASIGHFVVTNTTEIQTNPLFAEVLKNCNSKLFQLFCDMLNTTEDVETLRNISRALSAFSSSNVYLPQMTGVFHQVVGLFENPETDIATRRYALTTIANFTIEKVYQAKFFTSARVLSLISAIDHPFTEDTLITESIRALANLSMTQSFADMILSTHVNSGVSRVINSISGTDSLTDWEIEATVEAFLSTSVDPVAYKQNFLSSYNRDDNFNYESVRLLSNLFTHASDKSIVHKLAGNNSGVIRNLVQFLKSLNLKLQLVAIKVIAALSSYEDSRNKIISVGGLSGLCSALNTCSSEGTAFIVAALAQMPLKVTGILVNIIGDAGIHKLVNLLKLSDKQLQKDTAILLASMAGNDQFSKVVKAGGAQFLRSLIALVKSRKVHVQNNINHEEVKFDKVIGQGISGVVWRATWRDTPVAVKKFDEESIAFSEDEFQSEVALMSILRHENIVHCMGSCMEPCNLFIVLELFEKGNLEGIIYDKAIPLPIQLVVHLALGAAKGMLYLHTLGIIHRDLKVGNILVTNDWVGKVADFGMSRITDKLMTRGVGTPIYTSPEALAGRSYTLKADVYSFAFVLWELVTRQIPFADLPPFEAAIKASSENLRPEIPKNCILEGLIQQCWDHDQNKRPDFTEIVEVLTGLQRCIGTFSVAPKLARSITPKNQQNNSNNNNSNLNNLFITPTNIHGSNSGGEEDDEVEDQQYNYEKAKEILRRTLRRKAPVLNSKSIALNASFIAGLSPAFQSSGNLSQSMMLQSGNSASNIANNANNNTTNNITNNANNNTNNTANNTNSNNANTVPIASILNNNNNEKINAITNAINNLNNIPANKSNSKLPTIPSTQATIRMDSKGNIINPPIAAIQNNLSSSNIQRNPTPSLTPPTNSRKRADEKRLEEFKRVEVNNNENSNINSVISPRSMNNNNNNNNNTLINSNGSNSSNINNVISPRGSINIYNNNSNSSNSITPPLSPNSSSSSNNAIFVSSNSSGNLADGSGRRDSRLKRSEYTLRQALRESAFNLDCAKCNKLVDNNVEVVRCKDKLFHPNCFVCTKCKILLTSTAWSCTEDGTPFCNTHFTELFPKCQKCRKEITTEYVSVGTRDWHYDCFVCTVCLSHLGNSFDEIDEKPVCSSCFNKFSQKK